MSPLGVLVREWSLHLFQAAAQGSLAALAMLALSAAAARSAPAFRSTLLGIALAKFVIPPMLPAPTGIFSRFDAAPAAFFGSVGTAACAAIFVVHAAGMAASLCRLAAIRRRTAALRDRGAAVDLPSLESLARRVGLGRIPAVCVSAEVSVPCAVGGRRPAILLPAGLRESLSPGQADAILLHELCHLRRRDPARQTWESLVAALWWFLPPMHALVTRRRALREERCDEDVVRLVGDREAYSRALLAAVAFAGPSARGIAGVTATAGAADLARRLRRIAALPRPRFPRIGQAVAVALSMALFFPGVRPGRSLHSIHSAARR